MKIDLNEGQVTFLGKIYPQRYNSRADRANGHHFIVFSGGSNAAKALINTHVPDEQIQAGLEALGAEAGDNLTQAVWDDRLDLDSPFPDQHVQGTPLEIFVAWDQTSLSAYELFEEASPDDLRIRLGGHRELIPVWRSGCVTCLFSCPGGRSSNEAYTIRDQALDRHHFLADETKLPPDGSTVRVYIRPVMDAAAPDHESSPGLSG